MSLYGKLFAQIYDPFLAWGERNGMRDLRAGVLARASGDVLEIGAGTGLNLAHYPGEVTSLTLAEPEEPMAAKLESRAGAMNGAAARTDVVIAPAETLPFDDDSFDTVVSTLVLCTVEDVERSLAEIRRVLRPQGRLLFVEHVRADSPRLAAWQDRLHTPWFHFGYGCHCNRDTQSSLEKAGFDLADVTPSRWKRMPPIVAPLLVGEARV